MKSQMVIILNSAIEFSILISVSIVTTCLVDGPYQRIKTTCITIEMADIVSFSFL